MSSTVVGSSLQLGPGPMEDERAPLSASGSDGDSESAEDEESGYRCRSTDRQGGAQRRTGPSAPGMMRTVTPGVAGARPGKKTRGRVKIKMEFINNKLRRYTTFSKRKTGIMKKAYELSTLTGTQVLLLVASETGHVYTFATRKLQPMITSETGKALIQTCLNSPDSPPRPDYAVDQRMSATGFEETDITYQVLENEASAEDKEGMNPGNAGVTDSGSNVETRGSTSSVVQMGSSASPLSCWSVSNGTLVKASSSAPGVVQLPSGFALMHGAAMPHQSAESSEVQNCSSAAVPQMFLTSPNGTVQIPLSAVPLHSMLLNQQTPGGSSTHAPMLTELRVVNLDNPKD
ncbi:serum response factor-like [Trichomycterus rosablanca]|uniref:serum response factor-like n=1 Tax=Trichomycterus rosablanca TaxID=2290929 RepID=UPI002F35272A